MNFPLLLANLDLETLLAALLQTVLVIGAVFVLLAALFSHLRYEDLAERARQTEQANLTPLDSFRIQAGRFLGTLHKEPPPFSLSVLSLQHGDALDASHGAGASAAAHGELERRLRARCRSGDVVTRYAENRIGIVMPVDDFRTGPVLHRLLEEVSEELVDLPNHARVRIQPVAGLTHFPAHGAGIEDLRVKAEQLVETRLQEASGPSVLLPDGSAAPSSVPPVDDNPSTGPHLDPLTGVLALKELGPALQKMLANYRKDGLPVTFLYIDVDALESYNNHYGRAAGDVILKGLCRLLEKTTRAGDLIGRVEGEEFVVAMPCKPADAEKAANRITNLVKREHFEFGQNKLRITVSIGLAGYPDHGAIARLLYERAEMALYDAKTKGRNAVSAYHPRMSLPQTRTSRRASAEAY